MSLMPLVYNVESIYRHRSFCSLFSSGSVEMENPCELLPVGCWELIIEKVNFHREVSLVCKFFLSITNRLRDSLRVKCACISPQEFQRVLSRFPHLIRIDLEDPRLDLVQLLHCISISSIKLEILSLPKKSAFPRFAIKELGRKMASLRTLICSEIQFSRDEDLVVIINSLPFLEELDISYPREVLRNFRYPVVSWRLLDPIMEKLTLGLHKLTSINVSGNHFISNKSLIALTQNCKLLNSVKSDDCSFITEEGISYVIRFCEKLTSLSMGKINLSTELAHSSCFKFRNGTLKSLDFSGTNISDDLLWEITVANIPLTKLILSQCRGYTVSGMSMLLQRYHQSLTHLDLVGAEFLSDRSMEHLSQYMNNIIAFNLGYSTSLTNITLFNVIEKCKSLEELRFEYACLGQCGLPSGLQKNSRITSLFLAGNRSLDDSTLHLIGSICSELKKLDVSHCWRISDQGIRSIGQHCSEIIELHLVGCKEVQNIYTDAETFLNLEVLKACASGVDDEGLSKFRGNLRVLDLESCLRITRTGLNAVMQNCNWLTQINSLNCPFVNRNRGRNAHSDDSSDSLPLPPHEMGL